MVLLFSLIVWNFLIYLSISTIFKLSYRFYFFVYAHWWVIPSLCFWSGSLVANLSSLSWCRLITNSFSLIKFCSSFFNATNSFYSFLMYITFYLTFSCLFASIWSFSFFIYLIWDSNSAFSGEGWFSYTFLGSECSSKASI